MFSDNLEQGLRRLDRSCKSAIVDSTDQEEHTQKKASTPVIKTMTEVEKIFHEVSKVSQTEKKKHKLRDKSITNDGSPARKKKKNHSSKKSATRSASPSSSENEGKTATNSNMTKGNHGSS